MTAALFCPVSRTIFFIAMFFSVNALSATYEPIRIGLSGPFTGGSAPMGESMRNGVRLAVEEINGIGGVNGRLIELIERDDQANNELGARIADELTRMKVTATIGIVNTGVGLASIDYYQKSKIKNPPDGGRFHRTSTYSKIRAAGLWWQFHFSRITHARSGGAHHCRGSQAPWSDACGADDRCDALW